MVLTTFSASSSLLRERLVLVEVQVLGTAVVPLLLQDLLVLVLSVELLAHDNSFWSQAERRLFSAKWSISSLVASGETLASAIINNRTRCQAIATRSLYNISLVLVGIVDQCNTRVWHDRN